MERDKYDIYEKNNKFRGRNCVSAKCKFKAIGNNAQEYFNSNIIGEKVYDLNHHGKLSKSELHNRVINLVNLFKSLGFSEEQAVKIIEHDITLLNKSASLINMNYSMINSICENNHVSNDRKIDLLLEKRKNTSLLDLDTNNLLGILNIVFSMFVSRGYTEKDAYMYLYNNYSMLFLSPNTILNNLAIYGLVNLDENVFFNHPELINNNNTYSELYNAVKTCNESKDKITLLDIHEVISNNKKDIKNQNSSLKYTISEEKLKELRDKYCEELSERTTKTYERVL